MYKFRLNELLGRLSVPEYREALELLPKFLGCSASTLNRWRYVKKSDLFDLPYSVVVKLASYFNIPPAEIYTDQEMIKKNYSLNKKKDDKSTIYNSIDIAKTGKVGV